MNDVLLDYLNNFCTAYLDDILIYSDNILEYKIQIKKVLQRLREAGLQIDINKYEFNITSTKYLGFIISIKGIRTDPEKIVIIKKWLPPSIIREIQFFLGFYNFYRRFVRDYRRIVRPLVNLIKAEVVFDFNGTCLEVFKKLKTRLIFLKLLRYYDPKLSYRIETDASDGVIAGILSQLYSDIK